MIRRKDKQRTVSVDIVKNDALKNAVREAKKLKTTIKKNKTAAKTKQKAVVAINIYNTSFIYVK
jgi:hypothetical protein